MKIIFEIEHLGNMITVNVSMLGVSIETKTSDRVFLPWEGWREFVEVIRIIETTKYKIGYEQERIEE